MKTTGGAFACYAYGADDDAQRPFDDAGQAAEQIAMVGRRKLPVAGDPQNLVGVVERNL